ncbi:serine/threonine-protein kinase [Agromyces bauzanensis]|uniref:non-specific serine/threonine protein kinase n=1 Tax=Agromyces bauzanensis TaxID=1308924 RepID=A0A917US74_9MICO|nr:serine/threonine-protein kinase [Agromyces bauzanensis]GGJ81385.1 hypothetical protein GCM10011372_19740 [Agromyces bauzanensis]
MTTSPDRVAGDSFVGTTLGERYRLDGLIGRGGMASVYRGEDLALGRPVAVKVFAEAAEGIDDTERRRSETALLASLAHRALVRLYDAAHDPDSGREFLVMELIDGRDLREALKLGPLGPADAAGMLADLAEALHVIHERGIVHRDVKPANVLLEPAHLPSRTWNAKLADFGIARLIDDARLTRTGLLVGTPGYLSPEQVTGTAPGPAADVYSLGLLVLEARTGKTAFPGPAVEAASARLVRDPDVPASLGADWVTLLSGMTAREPTDRPSALDIAVAAATLDTTDGAVTAPTVAFGDLAAPATQAGGGAAPSTDEETDDSTADTRILPAADRSFFGVPAASASDGATSRRAARAGERSRRWVRPAIAVGLLATIATVVALLIGSALSAPPAAESTPAPLPEVPGELGVHLEELDDAVTG